MDAVVGEVIRRRQLAISMCLLIAEKPKNRRQRTKSRLWSRRWLLRRDSQQSVLKLLFDELGPEDPASFTNYTRMQEEGWNELLTLVTPHNLKKNTVMREALSPRDRLSVTLQFLAIDNTFQDLSYSTRIAANTISNILTNNFRSNN